MSKSKTIIASLNSEAGDCVLCPVPKKIDLLCLSMPGVFQTEAPAGAYFFTKVGMTLPTRLASGKTLCLHSKSPFFAFTAATPPLEVQHG